MKTKLIVSALLTAGAILAQVSIGVTIGPPPPTRVIVVEPRSPGPDYVWVRGYWYPVGKHYKWHDGYWTRPAFASARWMEPRYDGQQFYEGYWDGDRGPVQHDHRWDKKRKHDRDFDRARH